MKKYTLLFVMWCGLMPLVSAQTNPLIISDLNGTPITETKYANIEGSPYLYKDWKNADVIFKNGAIFKNIPLKYDLIKDELLFKNKDGKELLFVQPVIEFKFNETDETYLNGFKGVEKVTDKTFLQQLNRGKLIIYKKMVKKIIERKEYNAASTTQTFVENAQYFSTSGATLIVFKKDKRSLLELLADKQKEVDAYLVKNKLNVKDDQDLITIINYYNGL